MTNYDPIALALDDASGSSVSLSGTLGYKVNGAWRVVDPSDSRRFFVRFSNGNFVSALHRGKVPQTPDRPVLVGYDGIGRPIILGDDPTRIDNFLGGNNGNSGVGYHTHVRGSGMEYITDTWLLKPLRVTVSSGTTIAVSAGWYIYNGVRVYFAGSTLDIASQIAASSGYQNWIKVGINPVSNTLVAVGGTQSYGSFPLDISLITSIAFESSNYIPLAAIWANNGQDLQNYQINDLRFPQSTPDDDTNAVVTVARIITGHNGNVLSGHNGNVLLGHKT